MPQNREVTTRHARTVRWVVALTTLALIFDGYDLVVYGAVVPILLHDPSQLGAISATEAGRLGSYALLGVMVGALTAGAIGDHVGRRRLMLVNIAWFSIGMAITSLAQDAATFGLFRFLTGVGIGALVATAGAIIAEFAPAGKRNLYNAIVYSGVPAGGVLAALIAMVLGDAVGWRGLFLVGALPILFLLPLAWWKLPESPLWLAARGRHEDAARVSRETGVPLPPVTAAPAVPEKVGFRALASRRYAVPTAFLGLMSFSGLLLTYGLNTWLPEIMGQQGYGKSYSLLFLLTLNLGAIVGGVIASRAADRSGPQKVVASTFGLAAVALCLLPMGLPLSVLLIGVAIAGVGTIGTQVLIYGFVANYYESRARAAGVAWCAGFGRLGGIFGPLIGGALVSAELGGAVAFYIFAGVAVAGGMVTFLVPPRPIEAAPVDAPVPAPAGSTVAG